MKQEDLSAKIKELDTEPLEKFDIDSKTLEENEPLIEELCLQYQKYYNLL